MKREKRRGEGIKEARYRGERWKEKELEKEGRKFKALFRGVPEGSKTRGRKVKEEGGIRSARRKGSPRMRRGSFEASVVEDRLAEGR